MIWTSCFAHCGKVDYPTSIAHKTPAWFTGQTYPALYPPPYLLSLHDPVAYTKGYTEAVLSRMDAQEVGAELDGRTLLCYEKPGEFCHRHLVAKWLRDAGFVVEEFGAPARNHAPKLFRIPETKAEPLAFESAQDKFNVCYERIMDRRIPAVGEPPDVVLIVPGEVRSIARQALEYLARGASASEGKVEYLQQLAA